MNLTIQRVFRFLADEEAVTSVQYAMVVFLMLLALLTGLTWLGQATAVHSSTSMP